MERMSPGGSSKKGLFFCLYMLLFALACPVNSEFNNTGTTLRPTRKAPPTSKAYIFYLVLLPFVLLILWCCFREIPSSQTKVEASLDALLEAEAALAGLSTEHPSGDVKKQEAKDAFYSFMDALKQEALKKKMPNGFGVLMVLNTLLVSHPYDDKVLSAQCLWLMGCVAREAYEPYQPGPEKAIETFPRPC